jgi:hypothetical protein
MRHQHTAEVPILQALYTHRYTAKDRTLKSTKRGKLDATQAGCGHSRSVHVQKQTRIAARLSRHMHACETSSHDRSFAEPGVQTAPLRATTIILHRVLRPKLRTGFAVQVRMAHM